MKNNGQRRNNSHKNLVISPQFYFCILFRTLFQILILSYGKQKVNFISRRILSVSVLWLSQSVGGSYDVKDSSLIPEKRMPQHSEFLNGTYNFPAKPRNQWEIGIKGGFFR